MLTVLKSIKAIVGVSIVCEHNYLICINIEPKISKNATKSYTTLRKSSYLCIVKREKV